MVFPSESHTDRPGDPGVAARESSTQVSIIDGTPDFAKEKMHQIGNTNGDSFVVKPR